MRASVLGIITALQFASLQTSYATEPLPYTQKQDVVFAEVHGTGLLMDVFTPTGPANGLAIVDIASGAW